MRIVSFITTVLFLGSLSSVHAQEYSVNWSYAPQSVTQGGLQACGAVAVAWIVSYLQSEHDGQREEFSARYLYDANEHLHNEGDNGLTIGELMDTLRTVGDVPSSVLEYPPYAFDNANTVLYYKKKARTWPDIHFSSSKRFSVIQNNLKEGVPVFVVTRFGRFYHAQVAVAYKNGKYLLTDSWNGGYTWESTATLKSQFAGEVDTISLGD